MNALAVGFFALALGVLLGAFGAHGLGHVGPERLGFWATASLYHFIASIGLVAFGLMDHARRAARWPAWALLSGIALFSGSLYLIALGGPRWFGAITPVGGTLFIVGFVGLGLQALKLGPR